MPALAAMPASAQQAPGGGSYPGSILIPGTNTSFSVGGYVKADLSYDFSAQTSLIGGLSVASVPLDANVPGTVAGAGHGIHGNTQLTASESRFNIQTRTPTGYGEFKTFIEGDFTNPSGLTNGEGFKVNSNSSGFRLRHAYGTLGPFLAGQTFSLFFDGNATPETLDFGGEITSGPLRQPQFRYTYDAGNGIQIAGSAENPQTQVINQTGASTSSFSTGQGDKIPDFVGALTWNQPWGHVQFRGVVRDIYDHNGAAVSTSEVGWGLGASVNYTTWGKDSLIVGANGGDGIGRYSNDSGLVQDAEINLTTNNLQTLEIWDAAVGYQHWWTDQLRSNIAGSYLHIDYPSGVLPAGALATQNQSFIVTHVNLIWSPIPQIDTGIEYSWQERRVEDGQHGFVNRLQLSTKFKF